jgi:hypothetical protein
MDSPVKAKLGGIMKCIECSYFVQGEEISMMSRMMGYTAECSWTGTLFRLEDIHEAPHWCPLKKAE